MMMRAMTMPGRLLVIASLALGCGGKQADTTPSGGGGGGGGAAEPAEPPSDMVPPDKIDQITRSLERKRPSVSRCLSIAVDNKELPRNAAGKITLEIVISPAGRVDSVHVVRATLESKTLSDCVIGRIKEIQFPELPKPYETSYTYGFEAM